MLIQPGQLISSRKRVLFPIPVYINESPTQQLDLSPSELNPLRGTVFFEFTDSNVTGGVSGSPVIFSIVNSGAIATERIFLQKRSANGGRMRVVSTGNGTPNEVYDHFLPFFPNGKHKVAIGWDENNLKIWFNGVLFCEITGNYDRPVGLDVFGVGRLAGGGSTYSSGTIDKIEIYNVLLTDAQAAQVTFNNEMLSGVTFDADKNIFMFMGQSNSVGQATGSPTYTNTGQMFLLGNDMVMGAYSDPYADPAGALVAGMDDASFGIGYAGYFADSLSSLIDEDVAVCPANLSGQGLAADTSSTWNAKGNANYRTGGTKITGILGTCMGAMNQICMAQQFGTIQGVIWGQGETDANRAVSQATYTSELQELIQAVRYAAGNKGLPWFNVGMPEYTNDISSTFAKYEAIIDAQIAASDVDSNVFFVSGTDVEGGGISGDEQHYSLTANETVGDLIADDVAASLFVS